MAASTIQGRRRLNALCGVPLAASLALACGTDGAASPRPDAGAVVTDATSDTGVSCQVVESDYGTDVSFTGDLMPFFAVTCAFGGCHDGKTREAGLYLGPNISEGPADEATSREVHDSLVAAATTTPDLPRVTPHEPSKSFVMLKVQGCQNALGLSCMDAIRGLPCGARMPYLSDPLAPEKRAMLARWITDGALFSAGD
ncbi:MAG TPA: hypothetical protein VH062_37195 [Polyangiaceae bacterium]|jgi:hypothetical protein|nr:hypothetical protein [Polyangiaceae bacterium]